MEQAKALPEDELLVVEDGTVPANVVEIGRIGSVIVSVSHVVDVPFETRFNHKWGRCEDHVVVRDIPVVINRLP